MKIFFIRQSVVADEIIPPLHFGYLAGSISSNHEIRIFDQLRDKYSDKYLQKIVIREQPDVIGFSGYTKDMSSIKSMSQNLKKSIPDSKIILGGVQMTLMPKYTFEFFDDTIDFGFVGESEIAFSKFIDVLDTGIEDRRLDELKNLVWKKNGEILVNERENPNDLDEIPFPRWDLMDPRNYPKAPHGAFYKQFPPAPIITSRGCTYSCTFCAAPVLSGRKIRFRSMDNITEEIRLLHHTYGIKEIHIEDDNFSVSRRRVIEFSERMLKENLGLTWALPNGLRLDSLDIHILKLMKKAGCYALNVGIESGNDRVLKRVNKKITREKIKKQISTVNEAGLRIGGFFIIGFPWETSDEIEDTINFARKLDLDRIGISYFQPYPGSKEYEMLSDSGEYRLNLSSNNLALHTISDVSKNLSQKKLKQLRFIGFIKFYFRPTIFIRFFREVKSLEHFEFVIKRGIRWLTS